MAMRMAIKWLVYSKQNVQVQSFSVVSRVIRASSDCGFSRRGG